MQEKDPRHLSELERTACKLLLRSPRLTISQILELLEIGDREFRELMKTDQEISRLINLRQSGELKRHSTKVIECSVCQELFAPYGSRPFCSDQCAKTASLSEKKTLGGRFYKRRQALMSMQQLKR